MQERTRYRVTGTLFLLALAVILIPMLFDGEGAESLVLSDIERRDEARIVRPYDEVVPQTDVVARVQELKAEIDDEGFAEASGTRFGEPILRPITQDSDVYAVQAASFAQLDNAQAFREALRGGGFEAFISTGKSAAGVLVHRVAVGPLLSRADAEQMQASISDKFTVEARVMELSQ
jgi:cell division septation protein DedD